MTIDRRGDTGGNGRPLHVVLGTSGGTGSAVVRALLANRHRVRAVNRSGDVDVSAEVERVGADVMRPEDARRALSGAAVVYHAAQPPYARWVQDFPTMNRTIVDAVSDTAAKLVFADNLYMYEPGPDGRMTEDSPTRSTGTRSPLRAAMAEELLAAHRAGRVRVTIGRSSDYFGPDGRDSSLGEHLFGALVRGKRDGLRACAGHAARRGRRDHGCVYRELP